MDIQEKRLLEETAALARSNNKLLKKMHRATIFANVMRIVYWLVILGIAVGSFYFLQPYIEQMKELYLGAQGVLGGAQGLLGGLGI